MRPRMRPRIPPRMPPRMRPWWLGALGCGPAAACVACVVGGRFECIDDPACREGEVQGTCEPSGFCSFPDGGCDSGARYSRFAPDALAGKCTEARGSTSSSTGFGATTDADGSDGSSEGSPPVDAGPPALRKPHTVTCGDGLVEAPELCDDGDLEDADGCNHDCVPSGTPLWTILENGGAGGDDIAYAVALMPGGDIVATGRTAGDAGDVWMSRYDPEDGTKRRAWQYSTALPDEGRGVAVDAASVIYIVGTTATEAALQNQFLRAYYDDLIDGGLPDGNVELLWSRTITSPLAADDRGRAVALRPSHDQIVLAGSYGDADAPTHPDAHARGFPLDGSSATWTCSVGIDAFGNEAWAAVVTAEGRTFLAGPVRTAMNNARTDAWLGEIDLTVGTGVVGFAWTARVGELATNEVINALALHPDGPLVAAGHLDNHGFWSTWTPDGGELTRTVADDAEESEIRGIAVDATGAVVTVGQHASAQGMLDIEVVKYDPTGAVLWTDLHDGEAHADDRAHAVVIADDGTIVVAGQARAPASDSDIWLRKYAP
jgi:cysteine-rich repeat protein